MFVQFKWLLNGEYQVLNANVTIASLFLLWKQLSHLTKKDCVYTVIVFKQCFDEPVHWFSGSALRSVVVRYW